jgi:hypothetical protein
MAEALVDLGEDVFQYNREGWRFEAELRQADLYQRQKMRIKQVKLYREDIRDLFDLTVGKMDKYVIVCIVLLALDQSGTIRVFEKTLFAMDGGTRWQPEVREDAMHRFAF